MEMSQMVQKEKSEYLGWLRKQIEQYSTVQSRYEEYAGVLLEVLQKAAEKHAPRAIVQTRAKSIAGFAEVIQRNPDDRKDRVLGSTDLCEAVVIVQTHDQIGPICDFIQAHLNVDWSNTLDIPEFLELNEFGNRAVHYVVSFDPDSTALSAFGITIPDSVFPDEALPMKAEIQVTTALERAWSELDYETSSRVSFKLPYKWRRELSVVSALLESADSALTRINAALRKYAASYEAYMTEDEIRDEIAVLEIILEHCPGDYRIAHKVGKLAISMGDWQKAIDLFSTCKESGYQPIVRDLGMALCKVHEKSPDVPEYKTGQECLQSAIEADKTDVDAIASLAGTYKGVDDKRASKLYKLAYEIDPGNPYVLGNYLEYEIRKRRDASVVSMLTQSIKSAIDRCNEQIEIGMNYPWALYDLGKFYLLLGRPYMGLPAYLRAIQLSTAPFMLETSLDSLIDLNPALKESHGYDWALKLLEIGKAAKFRDSKSIEEMKKLVSKDWKPIEGAIVLIVGSCDPKDDEQVQTYRGLVVEALKDYKGTIISGGTDTGVGRLVGDIQEVYGDSIVSIGYTPEKLPAGAKWDKRCTEIRTVPGSQFTPLEPLQYWIDMLASGIEPSKVKVFGIGGNSISIFEYSLAISLGASVVILDSFREELRSQSDDLQWSILRNAVFFPDDAHVVRGYMGTGAPGFGESIREEIAVMLHGSYRRKVAPHKLQGSQSMADWDELSQDLKESNLHAVDHIGQKLNEIGCSLEAIEDPETTTLITFDENEIEVLAEMEHGRWVAERLVNGWKHGLEKDIERKAHPFIAAWGSLGEDVKEIDRELVRNLPEFLALCGYRIVRV